MEKKYKYKFTVFTPTYNRAWALPRVYDSLKSQTFKDFEWLIVDDGSTDETAKLVKKWQSEADFPIRYFYQENRGKHIAFNNGVKLAQGELFLTLDSDDACVPKALERFNFHWQSIPDKEKPKFSAVTSLCKYPDGKIVGNYFPKDVFDSNSLDVSYKYKVKGEKWGFHRTDVLKQFPFPEIRGIKFISESTVWSKIARHYKTRFVNEALRIYFIDDSGSLSRNKKILHPIGHMLRCQAIINDEFDYFQYAPLEFIKTFINYGRLSVHSKKPFRDSIKGLNNFNKKVLFLLLYPISLAVVWRDRLEGRI